MININKENDFLLGTMRVHPAHNQLTSQGETLTLQPKVMAVLAYLARNHERVVSSEELMEQLWPGRIVTQGSVQKSINSLRKALAELLGDQELITYYSKRGYQLTLTPTFVEADAGSDIPAAAGKSPRTRKTPFPFLWLWLGLALLVGTGVALIFLRLDTSPVATSNQVSKHHQTRFNSISEHISGPTHARDAEPHPDNKHLVYIRETLNDGERWEIESELMIRNNKGEDWQIATTQGSWASLAWSPSGQHLVAIELWRQEGLPSTPNFFERANDLYTFHIFSLDLDQNRLLEKHLLSQWQGRISSVTWWDESTLEFVATQGPDASYKRYRYTTDTQQLTMVEPSQARTNPLLSVVMNKKTALASAHDNRIRIDLLDEHQISHSSWVLDYPWVDISWIPDGSGVLVYAEDQQKLWALYWGGQRQEIAFEHKLERPVSRPRYRADGSAIYYAEEKLRSIVWLIGIDGNRKPLTDMSQLNHSAVFAPTGDRIAYASVRDNQIHLWLQHGDSERRLTTQPLAQNISRLIWAADATQIVYKMGRQIIFHDLANGKQQTLRLESKDIEPLAFDADSGILFVAKSTAETVNIWTIDITTLQQKQLTFGAVGSALEYAGDIYFQYRGKQGLWVLRKADMRVARVVSNLDRNSQLLAIDTEGVYFITGGTCRESDIFYRNFGEGTRSVFLPRDKKIVSTQSFHPAAGVLQRDCTLAESNILMWE